MFLGYLDSDGPRVSRLQACCKYQRWRNRNHNGASVSKRDEGKIELMQAGGSTLLERREVTLRSMVKSRRLLVHLEKDPSSYVVVALAFTAPFD